MNIILKIMKYVLNSAEPDLTMESVFRS